METQTIFGPGQLTKQTPSWANWLFGIVYALCTVGIQVIGGDAAISDAVKVRVINYMRGAEASIFLFSRMFGVKVKDESSNT